MYSNTNGSSITGGFLASLGTGVVRTQGTARVSGVTNEAELEVFNNTTLEIGPAGLINNARIVVNPTQGLNFTFIRAADSCTLSGTGMLYLNANTSSSDTAYLAAAAGATITNFAGHTISVLGGWFQQVALSWLVYRLTGSIFFLGLTGFLLNIFF